VPDRVSAAGMINMLPGGNNNDKYVSLKISHDKNSI
jgi:hypothetical protein